MSGTLALSTFLVSALVCVVAEVLIVRATVRAVRAPSVSGSAFPAPRRTLEIIWAGLPAIVLVIVLALTWDAVRGSPRKLPSTPAGEAPVPLPQR